MTKPDFVFVAHMGHDAPWIQIKTRKEVKQRIAYIKAEKPEHERPLRLRLLKIVTEPLPSRLVKARAAREKANAAREKANAAWENTYAAREKANAAWENAYAAGHKAYAAREKANAAWADAINSPVGVKFHKQVCGCAWTPEEPDILRQLQEPQ